MTTYYMVPRRYSRVRSYQPVGFNGGRRVPVDVHANDDEYVITASVPGLKPEDIQEALFIKQRPILLHKHGNRLAALVLGIKLVVFLCYRVSLGEKGQEICVQIKAEKGCQGNQVHDSHKYDDEPGMVVNETGDSFQRTTPVRWL